MTITERLAEIDRELASFGKTDAELEEVVRRARAEAPSSLDAIDAVLEALGEAREPAEPKRAPVETVAPPGAVAKPGTWERPERTEPLPEDASGLVEVPEEVIRRESLPPVLDLDGAAPSDGVARPAAVASSDPPRDASEVSDTAESDAVEGVATAGVAIDELAVESEPATGIATDADAGGATESAATADEHDESAATADGHDESAATAPAPDESAATAPAPDEPHLAALFDDEPLTGTTPLEASGDLADLFDEPRPEPEPGAHQDLADLLSADLQEALGQSPTDDGPLSLADLEDEVEAEPTAIFTAEDVQALRSSMPPADDASPTDTADASVADGTTVPEGGAEAATAELPDVELPNVEVPDAAAADAELPDIELDDDGAPSADLADGAAAGSTDAASTVSALAHEVSIAQEEAAGLDAQLDALVDETLAIDAAPSDEFELMIDEDELVVDAEDEEVAELAEAEGTAPRTQRPPPPPSAIPPPPPPPRPRES